MQRSFLLLQNMEVIKKIVALTVASEYRQLSPLPPLGKFGCTPLALEGDDWRLN